MPAMAWSRPGLGCQCLPGTTELVRVLGRYAQRGRPVHEAVLTIFCGHPELQLPETAVRAALTWFSRDREKGLVNAIKRAVARGDSGGTTAPGADPDSYDAAVDAVFEITRKLGTGRGRFLGTPITDPASTPPARPTHSRPWRSGWSWVWTPSAPASTPARPARCLRRSARTESSATRTSRRLRIRLEDRERAGKPLSPGPAGHSAGLISRSLADVPFSLICQVRDHLTIIGEAAAIRAAVITADREGRPVP